MRQAKLAGEGDRHWRHEVEHVDRQGDVGVARRVGRAARADDGRQKAGEGPCEGDRLAHGIVTRVLARKPSSAARATLTKAP